MWANYTGYMTSTNNEHDMVNSTMFAQAFIYNEKFYEYLRISQETKWKFVKGIFGVLKCPLLKKSPY